IKETWAEGAATPTLSPTPYEIDSGSALRQHLDRALKDELNADLALLPDGEARQSLTSRLEALSPEELWGKAGEKLYNDALDVASHQEDYVSLPDKVRHLRVILVYLDGRITHGALMSFLQPVLNTHSTIHIYLTDDDAAADQ
ncbi:MAG: hypothetical protein O3C57_05965, partial [Verrucomicrobia bacterium]|nr:hypothetical protein [Verrucomicrobiota bacterium]